MASPRTRLSRGCLGVYRSKLWEMRGLPGEDKAGVARHASWIFEHLGPEVEAERSEVLVPEFISSLGPALQCVFPVGFRVVDPSAAIGAQGVGKSVNLDLALPALGR